MAIETILLAVATRDADRVDVLAEATLELAEATGAEIVIAHAFDLGGFEEARERLADSGRPATDLDADEVAGRSRAVSELSERFEAAGIDIEVRGLVGEDPGDLVVDLADEIGADRVIVGGRSRSPAGKAVFGSTAQQILLSAPCPVTFVRGE